MESKNRSFGLDLYRILLAFLVIIVHSCTESTGGALTNIKLNTGPYFVGWILFAIAIPAVNSFALLSGYLSFGHNHSYKRGLALWFELVFYSVLVTLVATRFVPLSLKTILLSFAPLSSGAWWYLGAYIISLFLMPAFDRLVSESNLKQFCKVVGSLLLIICLANAICVHKDIWLLQDGYSPFWISLLYVVGAGIKKYKIQNRVSHKVWGVLWAACILLTAISRFLIENITRIIFGNEMGGGLFFHYLSITVVSSAICSLCFFASIKSKKSNKILYVFAVGSFASYIIHVHPLFSQYFMKDRYLGFAEGDIFFQLLTIISTAFALVVVCSLIDIVRQLLLYGMKRAIHKHMK